MVFYLEVGQPMTANLKLLAVVVAALTMLTATACDKDTKASASSVDGGSASADVIPAPADNNSYPIEQPNTDDHASSEISML